MIDLLQVSATEVIKAVGFVKNCSPERIRNCVAGRGSTGVGCAAASSSEKHLLLKGELESSNVSPKGSKIGFFFGDLGVEVETIVELVKDEFVSREFAYSVCKAFRASNILITLTSISTSCGPGYAGRCLPPDLGSPQSNFSSQAAQSATSSAQILWLNS